MSTDEDDVLAQATRALRDAGPPPLDELRQTRRRIMEAAGRAERPPRRFMWVVWQLAAFLLAATALAATTGQLAPMVDAVRGLFVSAAPASDDGARARATPGARARQSTESTRGAALDAPRVDPAGGVGNVEPNGGTGLAEPAREGDTEPTSMLGGAEPTRGGDTRPTDVHGDVPPADRGDARPTSAATLGAAVDPSPPPSVDRTGRAGRDTTSEAPTASDLDGSRAPASVREGDAPATATAARAAGALPEDTSATTAPRVVPTPEGARSLAEDPDLQLYRAAHRAHFVARDPRAALVAWDRYLAAHPQGTFALEARYNRALCLVRLGRSDAAERALLPFASGSVGGGYRRAEAQQLLDALRAR